ncbi:uncharacterized protein TRAVEDRAFT_46975 [Trametes versicolor FP-101664 SS1]|uniref:uncharacterized protein n=1 Tax=Trametes versicolor (strain FP-101664) TaxID=717944 RepID=UPI0004621640|nr:uncharacterized protein TRAVEDRAFT_46975 [Trametes versicolor FP-101664 SS1]EIW59674.1 hypothetical protein TRAVEDRAFT_46975 [Trametes versicolor FP-101664 SS1]
MISQAIFSTLLFFGAARAGTKLWDGSFNAFSTVADFDKWSWASQVGTYQWYIHGTQPTSHYLALDPSFKNPADTAETHGLRVTIDSTATWNSQMERAELIPQTTANLGQGNLFYHFSISHPDTNLPDSTLEHQILFFESHFTELKYGVAPNPTDLEWHVGGQPKWSTAFVPGTWYNFAYDIDFSAGTVGLWASTGGDPLVRVAANIPASTSTNSEDFHVGVLRIVNTPAPEDWYISGVFIENGPITTAIGSGAAAPAPPVSSPTIAPTVPPTTAPASTPVASPTSSATGPLASQYGQCGGTGYTGPTVCASPFTCKAVSPPYYYQCQ